MKKFWACFFIFWPILAVVLCLMAPSQQWWFPPTHGLDIRETATGDELREQLAQASYVAGTPLGQQIDDLFYLINWIVTAVFIGTQAALGYVLWKGATHSEDKKARFTHGSHNLEVIWTVIPAVILLFIAGYQMNVWAHYRIIDSFPDEAKEYPVAEVTARQFEWRIRYPAPGSKLQLEPQPDDLYTVNDLHVPVGRPVMIQLRTADVQHSFFAPELRVKQDAVPGLVIPVWFEIIEGGQYSLLCAELCGWGHYKMKARIVAQPQARFDEYLVQLQTEQNDDGVPDEVEDESARE